MDIAFLRSPVDMAAMPIETLQHMAVLADAVLQSYDLVFRCLGELVARDVVARSDLRDYINLLRGTVFRGEGGAKPAAQKGATGD